MKQFAAKQALKNELGDFSDVADDTSTGIFRKLYNYLNKNSECQSLEPSYPDIVQARYYLFYNHIRMAISKAHAAELTELNQLLGHKGVVQE